MQSNTQIVQAMYEAFGRGDVEHILGAVTDDLDWASEPDSHAAPWYGVHTKETLPLFFKEIGANHEVTEFTPLTFTSNETDVIAVIRYGMRVRATGKSGTMLLYHWFQLRDGKVWRYRGSENTELMTELQKEG